MIDEYFEMFTREQVQSLVDDMGIGIMDFGIPECHAISICFNNEYMLKFLIPKN